MRLFAQILTRLQIEFKRKEKHFNKRLCKDEESKWQVFHDTEDWSGCPQTRAIHPELHIIVNQHWRDITLMAVQLPARRRLELLDPLRKTGKKMDGWLLSLRESGHEKANKKKMFSCSCKLSLTSETSKRLMYHPNYWFTMDSHTHHCCDVLEQILC